MKIVLEVKEDCAPKNDDIIVYDLKRNEWKTQNKDAFLEEMAVKQKKTNDRIDTLTETLNSFKAKVNSKLEDYHEVLKTLTKEK